jgi:5-methylcytosine-specific restriction protein A
VLPPNNVGVEAPTHRNPDWTYDELILACDLVWRNNLRELRTGDPQVTELSELLQSYWAAISKESYLPTLRNPNGVSRKTSDIMTAHPEYKGKPTRGNKLDRVVLDLFRADPQEMHGRAVAIRATIARLKASGETAAAPADIDDDGVIEGGLLERTRLVLERDRGIRDKAVKAFRKQYGRVACEACSFDFSVIYGPHGADYIECHHRIPLSQSGETTTRIQDFVLLCSNCHRMIHRRRPWLSFEELVALISR